MLKYLRRLKVKASPVPFYLHRRPPSFRMVSSVNKGNSQNLADLRVPYCGLEVAKSFSLLTPKERLYTHWLNKASWAGVRIIQGQWTPYATKLYDLLITTFSNGEQPAGLAGLDALKAKAGVDDDEWEAALQYAAQVCLFSFSKS